MSALEWVPCASKVTVTTSGPLVHRCPHVDEVDEGSVEITWRTAGATLELHSLRAWLDTFADVQISHEDITEDLRSALSAIERIDGVQVTTHWQTAGFSVTAKEVWW